MLQFKTNHFLTGEELTKPELLALIDTAMDLKKLRGKERFSILEGKTIALVFEKPSLRTRLSFSVGVQELGGTAVELLGSQMKNEDPEDSIRVLQGMVHGLMLRTFSHSIFERMLPYAKIPIINGLSDSHHPCQILADLQTLKERFGKLEGLTLTYLGDGNNILHSLLLIAPLAGVNINYACPKAYQPDPEILRRAQARKASAKIQAFATPSEAAAGSQALYTDVWTSMGFESENATRLKEFEGYQINLKLLKQAAPEAIVLHCLPMQKGQEITQEIVDHPASVLFQQAENRLHVQKALMLGLYQGRSLPL